MKILAIDSSSITASVAILDNNKVTAEFFINAGLTHSQTLAPMVDSALKCSNTHPKDIDLYAVSVGPGSFTGLRIGAAIAKAMAVVNKKPCIGISTLEALAHNTFGKNPIVCTAIDARRDQIYTALFRVYKNEISRITEDTANTTGSLKKELEKFDEKIEFVGDGAQICYNAIVKSKEFDRYFLAPERSRYVSARSIAELASKKYSSEFFCAKDDFKLSYLRMPQAERLRCEKLLRNCEVVK